MKLFDIDSPLMSGLNKFADLVWLNVLTILCCLPIVTAGASITAMHYMCLKLARNEEGYITKGFFKSFKMNLKQSTIIWIVNLLLLIFIFGDLWILYFSGVEFHILVHIAVIFVGVVVLLIGSFVYPVLAKFDNTTMKIVKNSLVISMVQLPKSVIYLVLTIGALIATIFIPMFLPIYFFFGVAYPAYLFAKLYDKFFEKLENQVLSANAQKDAAPDEGKIFNDEQQIK